MANTEVGSAYVSIYPQTDGNFSKQVGKQLDGASSGLQAKAIAIGNVVGNAITGAVSQAASAIGDTVSKAFWNYADYEQLVGGVDTLFKGASATVQANAQNAFKTAGMSANEYMENVTSFSASLINSLDGDTEKAASVADKAIADMSDNANKMGTDMESITQAYQGFAKGQYQLLDNLKLGYGGTKGEMEKLLADAGKLAGTEFNIDSYSDVIEAIHVIQESMDITGTTMEEGSKTISGSLGMLHGAWENFLTAIGDGGQTMDLSTVSQNLIDSLGAVAANVGPAIARIATTVATQLPQALGEALFNAQSAMIEAIGQVFGPSGQKAAILFFDSLNGGMQQLGGVLDNLKASLGKAFDALSTAVAPLLQPLGAAFTAVSGVILNALSGVTGFVNNNVMPAVQAVASTIGPVLGEIGGDVADAFGDVRDTMTDVMDAVGGLVKRVWPNIYMTIKSACSIIASVIRAVWPPIKTTVKTVSDGVKGVVKAVWPVISDVVSTAVGVIRDVIEGLKPLVDTVTGIFNGVKDAITNPIETAKRLIDTAVGKIKDIFGGLHITIPKPKVPKVTVDGGEAPWGIAGKGRLPSFHVEWAATGGFTDGMTLIGAGEKGTELILPRRGRLMDDFARAVSSQVGGNAGAVYITVNARTDADANEIAYTVARRLSQLRRAGAYA